MARIALDAMGGDFAPKAAIAGAITALADLGSAHRIALVGQSGVVDATLAELLGGELAAHAGVRDRLDVVEAPEVIDMSDRPTAALRGKRRSSMVVGIEMHARGEVDAFVSAGNTGAQMAASTVHLKLHEGLTRPAIGTIFPTALNPVIVLDSGANVDCDAGELVQFARIGSVYAEDILGRASPVVGLLSIGEEPEKGNLVVKEAHQLLKAAGVNFQGNVEGRDIPRGASDRGPFDVVVCDGFTGNVILKFYEAISGVMGGWLLKAGVGKEQLGKAFAALDYAEYGGAPLLGVKGVSVICHGRSSPRAIRNAIGVALRAHESRMSEHIGRRLAAAAGEPGSSATAA
ncbi:MAG: phosphate acyltransferase PlsX [Gemmatimonadetes bacterium]|nr:phosphate acyltransferase PlsX [Gemmatimonadota bacterium]